MPLLATRGAASITGYGFFASLGPSYFIGIFGGANDDLGKGIASDSTGNLYVTGTVTSTNNAGLIKYNPSGTIQFQQRLSDNNTLALSIGTSSSGNVYVTGESNCPTIVYDSSGAIQSQIKFSTNAFTSIFVDSSSNYYICGSANPDGLQIVKLNSSNSVVWQRNLRSNSFTVAGFDVTVDASSNVCAVGYTDVTANLTFQIAKYNSSGTIQWQRRLGDIGAIGRGIVTDSSNNVYVCGQANDICIVAKYDSSGTIQWQNQLISANFSYGYKIAVDSTNNVYVCGSFYPSAGNPKILIAKYNSSGTIQWQRTVASSTGGCFGESIKISSNGDVCVCGYLTYSSTSISDFIFIKVPKDGTKTGTYTVGSNTVTYAASSLTSSVSLLTDSSTSATSNTSSLTTSTPTNTNVATTLTSTIKTL